MQKRDELSSNEKSYNIDIIFGIFLILVAVGKIIRYTIMKNVLVNSGIGHHFIYPILYGTGGITLFDSDSMTGDAGGNAVVIFRAINFFKINNYESWELYISVIWNIILFGLLLGVKKILNLKQFVFIGLSIIVLNIFDFTLAKEPIQMLYFIAIYYVLCLNNKSVKFKYILAIGIIAFSAISFRIYYFLIIMFMVLVQVLFNVFIIKKEKVKIKDIIIMLLVIVGFYFLFLNIMKVIMPTEYNELIRVRTRSSTAASDMRNIFKSTNLLIFSFDYLIMLLRMMFPIELLRLGIKYVPYVLYQVIITYFVIKNIKSIKSNGKIKNIALYLYIGFLFASATFEPDFGSWVRHEAVLFPILLILADIKRKDKERKNEKRVSFYNNSSV